MAKNGKMGKQNLKWGHVLNVLLVVLVIIGIYYLVYHTNLFGMKVVEGLEEPPKKTFSTQAQELAAAKKKTAELVAAKKKAAESVVPKKASVKKDNLAETDDDTDDDTDDEGDKASLSLDLTKSEGFHNRNLNNMAPVASNPSAPANMPAWFLASTKFTPECCPSTYSSSTGCACLNPQQINYLNQRGGNRTCSSIF